MNRTLAGFSLTLMLLTGLVVGQLRTLESAWPAPASASSAASLRGTYEFYDAFNDFLSTGNPTNLRSTLHPEFVDHSLDVSGPASGADLEEYIDAVRLVSPGVTLSATAVLREPGLVAVSVKSELPADEERVRLRLDARGSLPEFDLLKFRGSKVIERWSFPLAPALGRVEQLAAVTLVQSPASDGFILERFSLDPFEQLDFFHEIGIVILMQSGTVTCESVATSSLGQMQDTRESCRKALESEIIVESGRSIRLRNPGPEPAVLVTLRLQRDGIPTEPSQPEDGRSPQPEFAGQTLAFGSFDHKRRGSLEIVIHEVYLESGNGIAAHSVIGEEVVLTLTGEVDVSSQGGDLESLASNGQMAPIDLPIAATAGNAFFAHQGSRFAYLNSTEGEALVLVFSIGPAATPAA
ncbi:MAG: hypothetical protein AB7V46_03310 [Thermomicrobiales bacterium]